MTGSVTLAGCPPELDPTAALTPRAREIVAAADVLLEQDGWEAVTMRTLAEQLGIRAPSLYKHLAGRDALHTVLVGIALVRMGTALHAVLATGGGTAELLAAYRAEAHARPHLYRLATTGRMVRSELPPGLEDWAGAPFGAVVGGDPYRAQVLWALAHGLTVLELDGRFPTGSAPEESWQQAAAAFA